MVLWLFKLSSRRGQTEYTHEASVRCDRSQPHSAVCRIASLASLHKYRTLRYLTRRQFDALSLAGLVAGL